MKHQNRLLRLLLFATSCWFIVFLVIIYQKTSFSGHNNDEEDVFSLYNPKVILLNKKLNGGLGNSLAEKLDALNGMKQVCRIPQLDINGSEVIGFFKDPLPLNCEEKNEENWAYIDSNRRFMINKNAEREHGKVSCTASYFRRIDDDHLETDPPVKIESGDVIEAGDYFLAECKGLDDFAWSNLMWTVVPNTTRLEYLNKIEKPKDWSGLDVYFIGYDSLSQMSFRRKLPKTVKFIEEVLEGVVLNGINSVVTLSVICFFLCLSLNFVELKMFYLISK